MQIRSGLQGDLSVAQAKFEGKIGVSCGVRPAEICRGQGLGWAAEAGSPVLRGMVWVRPCKARYSRIDTTGPARPGQGASQIGECTVCVGSSRLVIPLSNRQGRKFSEIQGPAQFLRPGVPTPSGPFHGGSQLRLTPGLRSDRSVPVPNLAGTATGSGRWPH